MHKPNANFKLSKSAKRMMIATDGKNRANTFKNLMIDAELTAAFQPKRDRVRKESNAE